MGQLIASTLTSSYVTFLFVDSGWFIELGPAQYLFRQTFLKQKSTYYTCFSSCTTLSKLLDRQYKKVTGKNIRLNRLMGK
jgi:hypothetical protein